ncbi:prenyltransferase/squalene oxidase repeat-containing protein [Streptomyces sp. URMC 123]|uniref:prenyltransferase/squalene oxidase repeat-containing protein n=1 Tax=Streptomyces sp. URMC 123 TaxID=3423403 RepID=UPI003F1E0BAF
MPPIPRPRHGAATALTGALLATALLAPGTAHAGDVGPAPAAPAAPPVWQLSPAEAAATWAASQLVDGVHAKRDDYGLTADIVMGLAATRTGGTTANRATDWLAEHAGAYITDGDKDTVKPGATAKLALVAGIQDRDPARFGGRNLVRLLLDRLQENGRFTGTGPKAPPSNQFDQSLAVLALARAAAVPPKAVDFLAGTRCASGGFPIRLDPPQKPEDCTADADSTGMAVQALYAAGRGAEAALALDWLAGTQNQDGSFGVSAGGAGNANSTALAVQALTAGGRKAEAAKGVNWLLTLQLGCAAKQEDRGAVGYTKPVVNVSTLRATAQVIPALAGQALGGIKAAGSRPELLPIVCGTGDGTTGGTGGTGGTGTGGGTGGTTGAGGTGTGGGTGSAGTGTTAGTAGTPGTGGTTAAGASGTAGTGSGGSPATAGASGGTTSTGSQGATYSSGSLSSSGSSGSAGSAGRGAGGPALAATGASALPLAAVSLALLLAGGGAVAVARLRRRTR